MSLKQRICEKLERGKKKNKGTGLRKQKEGINGGKTETNNNKKNAGEEPPISWVQASVTIDIVFTFTPQLHQPQQPFHTVNI